MQLYTALVTWKRPPMPRILHRRPSTLVLGKQPSPELRQIFGTGLKLSRTPLPPTVTVAGCPIMVSDKLKTLGLTLDAALTFEDYVHHIVKACNFHIWGLCHTLWFLSCDVANTMMVCIVWTVAKHCYTVPLRSRSTSCRESVLELSAT